MKKLFVFMMIATIGLLFSSSYALTSKPEIKKEKIELQEQSPDLAQEVVFESINKVELKRLEHFGHEVSSSDINTPNERTSFIFSTNKTREIISQKVLYLKHPIFGKCGNEGSPQRAALFLPFLIRSSLYL